MVAILNIQLPIALGSLVNIIAAFEPGRQTHDYLGELVRPVTRLLGKYLNVLNLFMVLSRVVTRLFEWMFLKTNSP